MLNHQRFDYSPRGINEIYPEFEKRESKFPNMIIEQQFFFISHCRSIYLLAQPSQNLLNALKWALK